jgi:hypothetical protein
VLPTWRSPAWRSLAEGNPSWRNPPIPDEISPNEVHDGG